MKVAVALPAYNPGRQFPELIEALAQTDIERVIVVNDGSGPAFEHAFRRLADLPRVYVLRHAVNLGKGAALKTALNFVLAAFPELVGVVTADADGQHLVDDIVAIAKTLLRNPDALILGVRQFDQAVPMRSRFGNTLTRHFLRFLVGQRLADTQTGLRGIPKQLIPQLLKLPSSGYEFELDMLIACKHRSCPIVQQKIRTIYIDDNRSSHFSPVFDSMRIYFVLFRFTVNSLITALIDNLVFAAVYFSGASVVRAQAAGRLLALTFNYAAARSFVFLSQQTHGVVLPRYLLLVLASGFVSYSLIQLLISLLSFPVLTAKVTAELLLFIVNFLIQRDMVFTKRAEKESLATDWDGYYRTVPWTARVTRRYTTWVLLGTIRRFGGWRAGQCRRIVEIGGGNSCFLDAIRRAIAPDEYHIIDSNQYSLDLLRRRIGADPAVHLYCQDVRDVDLDLKADVAFSVGLIEHFREAETRRAVRAHLDLLRPNGVALLSFPTPTWLYRAARLCLELLGLWRFPDERPLERKEVAAAIEPEGEIIFEKVLWPLVLTQRLIVARKRASPERAAHPAGVPAHSAYVIEPERPQ